MKQYYNYIYLDPRKPGKYEYKGLDFCLLYEPFYVGKGKNTYKRYNQHITEAQKSNKNSPKLNKIRKIINNNYNLYEYIILFNYTIYEDVSLQNESNIIKEIGLCNLTNNTSEIVGVEHGIERNKKISKALKGKQKTEEHKENMRKQKTEEHKENISNGRKGIKFTKEHKENMSKCRVGVKTNISDKRRKELKNEFTKNNPNKITIKVYDNNGNEKFVSYESFSRFCLDNHLPHSSLQKSYLNNGRKLFDTKIGRSLAIKSDNIKFVGWYALKVED